LPDIPGLLRALSINALPIVLAVTFHEAAHGYVAEKKGDPTARMLGRVTLNPIAHIDPIGTILLPIVLYVATGFMFGYAKPVPVNWRLLRDQKRDPVYVAAAGVVTNLALAAAGGILLRVIGLVDPAVAIKVWGLGNEATADGTAQMVLLPLALMARAFVMWNVVLAIFNLIPIPPLDGGRIAVGVLPHRASMALASMERYGMLILILLMMSGIIWRVIGPIMALLISIFLGR
jgi:Zn-dependent protease